MTVHVVTNGQGVLSAAKKQRAHHVLKSGTSMSTPLAAGIITLLREWLEREENPHSNSGSLLRTMIIHCAVPLPNVHKTAQGFGFLQPALLTDYGDLTMKDVLIDAYNKSSVEIFRLNSSSESGIFRASMGWYTPAGYALENLAHLSCTKNGELQYNNTDNLNTLKQMTIHLLQGDSIVCKAVFVRSHDNEAGFNVSVVAGVWPVGIVYISEDVNPNHS
jgi:hypothetical protein